MAVPSNTQLTYASVGNRESLADIIYRVEPEDTPFQSAIARGKATAVFEEWQTQALADVDTDNAVLEGDDTAAVAVIPTDRIGNYCQISKKAFRVSGTQEVVDKAGRKSEIAYQQMLKGLELRRDIEAIVTRTQGRAAGAAGTARKARALESWIESNENRGTDGVAAANETSAPTDGTQRDFTEALLRDVIQQCYASGANPSLVMVGPINKMNASGFQGRSTSRQSVSENTVLGAASLYTSDFGDLRVVPNRFQRDRTAFVLDPSYAEMRWLRPIKSEKLAKTGDSELYHLVGEWTLCMKNEQAHGVVADLNTAILSFS